MKRILIIIFIISAGLLVFIFFARNFAAGSYAHAEIYELNAPESKVIKAIIKLKSDHPALIVPNIHNDLKDGRKDSLDYWYHCYFYYKDKDEIVYCWTRPLDNEITNFAFVGVNTGLELGHWKDINNDFNCSENKQVKKEFEARILRELKKNLN